MADEVRVTLEPIRLQAMANIAILEVAHALDDEKRQRILVCLRHLVEQLDDIGGPGLGIDVNFGPPGSSTPERER
jgi:hypothetical protein